MNLPKAPLSEKVRATLPPNQPMAINSPVRSHSLSIAAILGDTEEKVPPEPLQVATESIGLRNLIKGKNHGSIGEINKTLAQIQSENCQGGEKPGNTEVINGADKIIQNFLSGPIQNVPFWTPDAVTLVMGKIYGNQWKKNEQSAQSMSNGKCQEVHRTRSFYQNQTGIDLNPNSTSIHHQIPANQKPNEKRAPKRCLADEIKNDDFQTYPELFPGDKKTLNLQLIEGDIIHCEHLRKRVRYELKTRGISQKLFSEKIFGRSKMTLRNLLDSEKEWKDLKDDRAKQPYWNVLQWINASDFDKAAVLNGEAPSDPNLNIIVTPYKEMVFSAERRREIEKLCSEGQFPTLKERREMAAKWNIDETVIGNFAVRISKQQNEKK